MNKTDLSLVSTNDMLIELNRRFDVWLFTGMQLKTHEDILTLRKWRGNSAAVMGLAAQIQQVVFYKQMDNENFNNIEGKDFEL